MMTRDEVKAMALEDLIKLTAMLEGEFAVRLIQNRADEKRADLRQEIQNSGDC